MCDLRKTHKVIPNSQCGFVTRTNTQFLDRKEFQHCIDRRRSTFIGAIPGFLIHLSDSQQTFLSCGGASAIMATSHQDRSQAVGGAPIWVMLLSGRGKRARHIS